MANAISVYDPIFYASEALIQLEKTLGMAIRYFYNSPHENPCLNPPSCLDICLGATPRPPAIPKL